MWDDPEIVAPERCRYDLAVEVPRPIRADGVGHLQFPAMQVAEIEIRGGVDLELRAIDWLHRTWLPTSGYVPSEQPAFEAFLGRPFAHGDEYWGIRETGLGVGRAIVSARLAYKICVGLRLPK